MQNYRHPKTSALKTRMRMSKKCGTSADADADADIQPIPNIYIYYKYILCIIYIIHYIWIPYSLPTV